MSDITENVKEQCPPLNGDPKRQAVDTWRGYVYQIWQSVDAWITLDYDTILYLEGAEDFDTVRQEFTETVQIKATSENITLNSKDVFDAIKHYWQLVENNHGRVIAFRFLTLSNIGEETDSPFGDGVKGLELWQKCSEDSQALQKICDFLIEKWEGFKLTQNVLKNLKKKVPQPILKQLSTLVRTKQQAFLPKKGFLQEIELLIGQQQANKYKDLILGHSDKTRELPDNLRTFLSQADAQTLLKQLIEPIKWETGSKSAQYIEEDIKRKLIRYGSEKYSYPPSDSKKVVDRLLREVIENLCNKEQTQRVLDRTKFEEIFENETKRTISYQQSREYELLRRNTSPFNDPFNNPIQWGITSNKGSYFIQNSIPPFPKNVFPRVNLVNKLANCLHQTRFLVLAGSSGMGKTTLAKIIAFLNNENWFWIDFGGVISEQIALIFQQFASLIDQRGEKISIICDALELSSANFQRYEDYFGGLLYALSTVHGQVIITSQTSPSPRLLSNLDIDPSLSVHNIPCFEEDEVIKFAIHYGCREEQSALNWGKIIFLKTQGHPQLVHAWLSFLANRQWPRPNVSDWLQTPPDVAQEQTEIKIKLFKNLSPEQISFIYRLSAINGQFTRDHAIEIGAMHIDTIHSTLPYPGNVFDQLIGPWIESPNNTYYQVSPTLQNAAEKDWSKQAIQKLHAALGQVFLHSKPFTTKEAANAFFHAWLSRSKETLVPLIQSFLTASQETWQYAAYDLSWFIYVGTEPQYPLFPEEIRLNGMLRLLQFEIAATISIEKASLIAEMWDKETVFHEPQESFFVERFTLAHKILIRTQVQLPPKRLLDFLVEIAKIQEHSSVIQEKCRSSIPPRWLLDGDNDKDIIPVFFSFIVHRCSDKYFLDALLNGLEDVPSPIRERMFAIFTLPGAYTKILTNSVWMHEADSEIPNWTEAIRVLDKMITLGKHWNVPPLVFEAARAISIIHDEYLHDSSKALSILEEIAVQFGSPSNILEYARAQIFFNQKRYEDALSVLKPVLPGWIPTSEYDDSMSMFACRMAAMSAAYLNDWSNAADLFMEGYSRAKIFTWWKFYITGFLADKGFALWKAEKFADAVSMFKEVLESLESLPDPEKDLDSFTVRKAIEHTLLWIKTEINDRPIDLDVREPFPGFCSNPDRKEHIRELALTPIALSWAHLAEIEFHLKLKPIVFEYGFSRFIKEHSLANQFVLIRAQLLLAELDIRYAFRKLQFDNLPIQLSILQSLSQRMGKALIQEKESFKDSGINKQIDEQVLSDPRLITEALFMALVALVASERFTPIQIEIWRQNIKNVPSQDHINGWLELTENILLLQRNDAINIMRNNNENNDRRLLSALKICLEEESQPESLFYAHTLLIHLLLLSKLWVGDVADYLAQMFSIQWLKRCKCPALLHLPKISVPAIESACKNETSGLKKIAQILLAASYAVSVKLPQSFIEQLHRLAI